MEGCIRRSVDIFKCFVISYLSRGLFSFFQQCDKLQDNYNVVLSLQEQLARMQQVDPRSFGVYRMEFACCHGGTRAAFVLSAVEPLCNSNKNFRLLFE